MGRGLRVCDPNSTEAQHEAPGIANHLDLIISQPSLGRFSDLLPRAAFSRTAECSLTTLSHVPNRRNRIPLFRKMLPKRCAGLTVPSGDAGARAETSELTSTAPARCPSGDELFLILSGFPPKLLIPSALEDDHDPGLVERGGAQLEEKLGDLLPVPARDLKAASPDLLGEDGKRDAQRRLPEASI